MINKTQKKALLKSLGKKHIRKIQDYALANNFLKDDGKEYSRTTFSAVFNGDLELQKVEKIIFAAADFHFNQDQENRDAKNDFVNKVNTPS